MTVAKMGALGGVLLSGGLLAACGNSADAPETPEASASETAAPVETAAPETPKQETAAVPALDTSPIIAESPSDAVMKLNARDEIRRRISIETGQRIDEVPLEVSWPYGTCVDAASLIPPPKEGWRLFALSPGEWPQGPEFARITYSSVDESLTPGTSEHSASKENISIYISSGTPDTQAMKDLYTNPQLAEMMLVPGPYNYPVRKMPTGFTGRGALLGDFFVQTDGTGKDMDAYFNTIVECAIDNVLVAEGVDIGTLRDAP